MEPLTKDQWEAKWEEQFKLLRKTFPSADIQMIQRAARKWVMDQYGPPIEPPKEPGPPWWLRLSALPVGVDMTKIWAWFNGKKTIVGAIITILATLAGVIPVILGAVGVDAILIAKVVGIATTVVGLAHKLYKFLYQEEHP